VNQSTGPARKSWPAMPREALSAHSGVMDAVQRHREEFGVPTVPARAPRHSVPPSRPAMRSSFDSELDPITEQSTRPTDVGPVSIQTVSTPDRSFQSRKVKSASGAIRTTMSSSTTAASVANMPESPEMVASMCFRKSTPEMVRSSKATKSRPHPSQTGTSSNLVPAPRSVFRWST
jgi:hypothetical protein